MDGFGRFISLAGRFLLAQIFVLSGLNKLMSPGMALGYIAMGGIPHSLALPALVVSIFVELGLGLLVMVGYKMRWAALLMLLWFIPVTILFHLLPWREAAAKGDAMMAMGQQINLMKNISIMGGLLLIIGLGSAPLSVEGAKIAPSPAGG